MRRTPVFLLVPVLALAACQPSAKDAEEGASGEMREPAGSYDVDPASGEVTATHTDEAGVTTTLRAGKSVAPVLPKPFTIYPGSTVASTTRVEQGEGAFVTLDFSTPDDRAKVVEYYRKQAVAAGVTPEVEVAGENATTLAGENATGGASFTLVVTRKGERTEGQLSVASGFD